MAGSRLLVALVTLGCAPEPTAAPPPRAPAKLEIERSPSAAATEAPVAAPAPPAMAELGEPADVACRVKELAWSTDALRLRDGGPVYAKVIAAPTTLLLPSGEPRAPMAVFEDAQVVLRAIVPRDVRLYLRAPTALRRFVIPKAQTSLDWTGGKSGSLVLGVSTQGVLSSPDPVSDDVACDTIGANPSDYAARAAVTPKKKLPEKDVVPGGADLSDSPGGAALARLEGNGVVEVVQVKGAHTKVMIDDHAFVVFGWVASSDLVKHAPAISGSAGTGPPGVGWGSKLGGKGCARDLTLVARVGEESAKVGVLKSGSSFVLKAGESLPDPEASPRAKALRSRFVAVTLPDVPWLRMVEGAQLLFLASELETCAERSKP